MSDSTTQPTDTSMEMTEELDATVEEEINHNAPQVDNMNLDGAGDAPPTTNATLREFLGKMDEFAPIVCSLCLLNMWTVR
jgi:transcription initiation factor TFIID subunit 10